MKYKIDFCDDCNTWILLCGECGMNTCSGSYGPWAKYLKGGKNIPECTSCPEAYDLTNQLHILLNKTTLGELINKETID
jgi:hypothetical protein